MLRWQLKSAAAGQLQQLSDAAIETIKTQALEVQRI